jgi:uncharacterized protein YkwD
VAAHRYALLACICAVFALNYLPASAALASGGSHVASYRSSARHGHARHHARCGTGRASHARRASFRTSAGPRNGRHHAHCPRLHRLRHGLQHRHRHATRPHVHRHAPRARAHRGPAAAHSSACVDANLTPTSENVDRIRAATVCLINRERTSRGENPLSVDPALQCAAQAHSEDMAARDYFEHVGPNGDTPVSRVRRCGYIYSSQVGYEVGENIGWGTLWLATPRAMVAAWMGSPGHRANILDGHFRNTAIGVAAHPIASLAHGQPGAIYTQDFGVIIAG